MTKIIKEALTPSQTVTLMEKLAHKRIDDSLAFVITMPNDGEEMVVIDNDQLIGDSFVVHYVLQMLEGNLLIDLDDYRQIPLEELGLSARAYNALLRSKVTTVDLVENIGKKRAKDRFLAVRSLGPESIKQVLTSLLNIGLPLNFIDSSLDTMLVEVLGEEKLKTLGFPSDRLTTALEIINTPKKQTMVRPRPVVTPKSPPSTPSASNNSPNPQKPETPRKRILRFLERK